MQVVKNSNEELSEELVEQTISEVKGELDKISHKHDYNKDKSGWVIYKNKFKKKIKLRQFISNQVKELVFLDKYKDSEKTRKILIKKYNEGGVNAVDYFVNMEFLKEIQVTVEEFKELGKDEE